MLAPPVPPQVEQGELPIKTISAMPLPETTFATPLMTLTVPPVGPTTFNPSITISASKFRTLTHTFQTLTTTHAAIFQPMVEMRAHQDQQTAILCQIQQHLGLLPPPQPDLPVSSEPLALAEDTILAEDTTTVEVQIPPPQEATTDAIAPDDPQDEPQTVDTVIATPEDPSFPPEAAIT